MKPGMHVGGAMPFEMSWYLPKRVVLLRYYGHATVEDIDRVGDVSVQYVLEGTPPVHIIADMTEVETFPTNLRQSARAIRTIKDPAMGWTVIISTNPLMRVIIVTLSRLAGFRFHIATSREQARAFLVGVDATLKELLDADLLT